MRRQPPKADRQGLAPLPCPQDSDLTLARGTAHSLLLSADRKYSFCSP